MKTKRTAVLICAAAFVAAAALAAGFLVFAGKSRGVKLFYYNARQAAAVPHGPFSDRDAVLPVERRIRTGDVISGTLRLLLEGAITPDEAERGFTTEFPDPGFTLRSARLRDGVLTLLFEDKNNFTTGGSSRVLILKYQIEKTALQFEGVKQVVILPEELFQP